MSGKNTQENYEQLQKQYNDLQIQFKRQKRRIRNVNRSKYNLLREEAAKSNVIKEFRKKSNNKICNLNNKITKQTQEIEDLQEECADWRQAKQYTYQRYIVSLSFAICSTIAWCFTLHGVENCIC